jgi:hypothetical protein
MTVKEFFEYFKDNPFKYIALGVDGGKDSLHTITFKNFGSVGPNAWIQKTFNFEVEEEVNGEITSRILNFANFYKISEEVLSMELINVVEINLRGNNRTKNNYWNDHSNITIKCRLI